MERRDFIILAATGAAGTLTLQGCNSSGENLKPLYIANDKFIAGADYWHATVCRECPAGCGLIVRKRDGKANKVEGNPLHPISRGKSCVRAQAALNTLYNPDRIRAPRKRAGERGAGQWTEIGWEEAIKTVVDRLTDIKSRNRAAQVAWIEGNELTGQFGELLSRFWRAYGTNYVASYRPFAQAVERAAASSVFGRALVPSYDLARADYILSFGARFLETWSSPVHYSRGYAEMRRGGRLRGRFVHVEPRLSLTAANADEWLPVKPGREGDLARAIAGELARLRNQSLPADGSGIGNIEETTGIRPETIKRIAKELNEAQRVAVIGGDSAAAHTNGSFNLANIHALGGMVNGAGEVRYLAPASSAVQGPASNLLSFARKDSGAAEDAGVKTQEAWLAGLAPQLEILFLHEANPLYHAPSAFKLAEAFQKIPFIVSFSSFEDETTAFADLILPDHTPFERWDDDVPQVGVKAKVVSLAQPIVEPLYQTRQTADVLLEIASQIPSIAAAVKDESYVDLLKRVHAGETEEAEEKWEEAVLQGGMWEESANAPRAGQAGAQTGAGSRAGISESAATPPQFAGDEQEFPFHFLPYEHLALGDGRTANSPLLQELPDPMTSVCWGSWVEINPQTAARLGISEGDLVSVESPHGKVEAPAVLYPGIRPDTVAMPAGQGHERYGRYASGRGANPLSILAPMVERQTGQLAWAATRVRVTKVGAGRLVTFGTSERVLEERQGVYR